MPEPRNGRLPDGLNTILLAAILIVLAASTAAAVVVVRRGVTVTCSHSSERAKPAREHIGFDIQYDAAIHEAGHAVADVVMGFRVTSMYVAVDKDKDDKYLGMVNWDVLPDDRRSEDESRHARIVVYYAGNVAEQVILGRSMTGGGDRDNADDRILEACRDGECGECPPDSRVGEACLLNGLVNNGRAAAKRETHGLIGAHRETVVFLANELMRQPVVDGRRTMTGEAVEAFLKARGIERSVAPPPVPDAGAPPSDDDLIFDWNAFGR